MPRILDTLVGRLALWQLLLQLLLPPILYYRLDSVLTQGATQTFRSHSAAYARALANELDLGDVLLSPTRTVAFLDAAVEGGGCAYAAIDFGGRLMGSSLVDTPDWIRGSRGAQGAQGAAGPATSANGILALSQPILASGARGVLYLGFDARPVDQQVRSARQQVLVALAVYALVSVAAAIVFARLVSWPLTELQQASRRAALGDPAVRIQTGSSMREIVGLANDLEYMRGELVGAAALLRSEMQQREREQGERIALERQLRHEQRLATVGTFAGGLAHEFNNILQPMTLYTENALQDIAPGHAARESVEQVLVSATRASNLIARMLAFSRPLGEVPLQAFDPVVAVEETLQLFGPLLPANVELRVQLATRGVQVLGDAAMLGQLVLNLLSNAVHAMRGAGGVLTVTLDIALQRQGAPAGGPRTVVELRVADTGTGMAAEVQERIFEPFFTTREVGEGTGLGLSVAHGIVARMGGTISVSSRPGQGTEFLVVLPAMMRPGGG